AVAGNRTTGGGFRWCPSSETITGGSVVERERSTTRQTSVTPGSQRSRRSVAPNSAVQHHRDRRTFRRWQLLIVVMSSIRHSRLAENRDLQSDEEQLGQGHFLPFRDVAVVGDRRRSS